MDVKEAVAMLKRITEDNISLTFQDEIEAVSTVLSELEKKDDQIEYVKNEYGRTIEEKDLIINEMADIISSIMTGVTAIQNQFEEEYCEFIKSDEDCCWKTDKECSDCIKEYFTKEVENMH